MTMVMRLARAASLVLPGDLLRAVLPAGLRWDPARAQVAVDPEGGGTSLLIAPANSAGQAHLWARAARENLRGVRAVNLMTVPRGEAMASFATDFEVPLAATIFSRAWQRKQRAALRAGFTHVLVESGRGPYGGAERSLGETMVRLADDGLSAATVWHGSDIRLPSVHAAEEPDSPFGAHGSYAPAQTARLEQSATTRLRAIENSSWPVFVSTPGLLDTPRAAWLPVVVDECRWWTDQIPLARKVPVVAYAPSNAAMKGDDSIDAQLHDLEREGTIRYRRIRGVHPDAMPEIYRTADLVLDQFRLGDYGVAACEAMAAGRPVIGHVSEKVRERVKSETGFTLPIIEARLKDVATVVRTALRDRDVLLEHSQRGVAFVTAVHSGRASAQALAGFLGAQRVGGEA